MNVIKFKKWSGQNRTSQTVSYAYENALWIFIIKIPFSHQRQVSNNLALYMYLNSVEEMLFLTKIEMKFTVIP